MPIDTVVVSLTPACNLECQYCQNEPPFRRYPRVPMGLQTLRNLISSYKALVIGEGGDTLRFCYSGGEPLLAGRAYFESVLALQRELVGSALRIENTVQTNGTLVDSTWAGFFHDHGFAVSVSIDGPGPIHDVQRPMKIKGTSSLDLAIRGIEMLRGACVRFGILTVVSKNSVHRAKEIFEFVAALRPNMIGFLPCVDRGPAVSSREFGRFLVDAFDAWIEARNPRLLVREFAHIIQGMLGIRHTKGCQYAGDCPRHVNVAPDGSVSVCDQYIGKPEGYLGNILAADLGTIISGQTYRHFRERVQSLPSDCENCGYVALCNGGCSYRRSGFKAPDYLCEGRKMLFRHIEVKLETIICTMMSHHVQMLGVTGARPQIGQVMTRLTDQTL